MKFIQTVKRYKEKCGYEIVYRRKTLITDEEARLIVKTVCKVNDPKDLQKDEHNKALMEKHKSRIKF